MTCGYHTEIQQKKPKTPVRIPEWAVAGRRDNALDFDHISQADSLNKMGKLLKSKTKQNKLQDENGVAYSFSSPRNEILNQSIRNCLISTSEVRSCHPQKESNLAINNLLFFCLV